MGSRAREEHLAKGSRASMEEVVGTPNTLAVRHPEPSGAFVCSQPQLQARNGFPNNCYILNRVGAAALLAAVRRQLRRRVRAGGKGGIRTLGSAGGGLEAEQLPAVGVRPGCHCIAAPAEMSPGLAHHHRKRSAHRRAAALRSACPGYTVVSENHGHHRYQRLLFHPSVIVRHLLTSGKWSSTVYCCSVS